MRRARLVLADGTCFEGEAFGAKSVAIGEVVFTTGMTGYQEVLTDPSYAGQIVTMTAPEIGNTGANAVDDEHRGHTPSVAGFIVRNASITTSNHRADESLDAYLERHGVVALSGIDTRRLVRILREKGSQNGAIGSASAEELADAARRAPSMEGLDLVGRVKPDAVEPFAEHTPDEFRTLHTYGPVEGAHVVAIDLGMKRNILRSLVDLGARVTVAPPTLTASEVLALGPDGVFVSNGPGDPAAVTYAIETLRDLVGKKPLFGICLGHQLLALAAGARTYKLKFGHRGLNQPVKDLDTGRVEITSQNHGFAVDLDTLPKDARATHVHLNDGTSEGLVIPDANAFSVQFHPEAAAGPHDTLHLFERFARNIA
ncbi:MAG: glutamine-hydrolyzing carbamoyl-phosphate synthase small subunit [Polyangiaceae bacterium]